MTKIEQINHFTNQFNKVVGSHGVDSEHAVNAFFVLQAAKMGMPTTKIFKWANAETERLHEIALQQLP